jgi:alpha-amylase
MQSWLKLIFLGLIFLGVCSCQPRQAAIPLSTATIAPGNTATTAINLAPTIAPSVTPTSAILSALANQAKLTPTSGSQPATAAAATPSPAAQASPAVNGWWNDTVFYEVFVRSFKDSDGDGTGDIQGLIEQLDYLNDGNPDTTTDLGITGIWLMPITESSSYHGYDVVDYYAVESDYGTQEDFKRLIEAAQSDH